MAIEKVVSGGQTGVDRAALDAARACTIPQGGWCPNGRRAEDGVIPERYPLKETPSEDYRQRTEWNVRDSDGTLIVTDDDEIVGGTAVAHRAARRMGKPVVHARTSDAVPVEMIRAWCEDNDIRVLNVAGPREGDAVGIHDRACAVLEEFLKAETAEMVEQQ